jgi:hypothetical protein
VRLGVPVQFRWQSTADCIGFSFRNSGFDTRPFAPATPATLAGYAGQNSETERASGISRSPSLFQSDYRIWMQFRPLCEKSRVCGNRQSAIVRAGKFCEAHFVAWIGTKSRSLQYVRAYGENFGRDDRNLRCTVIKEIVLAYI